MPVQKVMNLVVSLETILDCTTLKDPPIAREIDKAIGRWLTLCKPAPTTNKD
jgi:hypothetical protein